MRAWSAWPASPYQWCVFFVRKNEAMGKSMLTRHRSGWNKGSKAWTEKEMKKAAIVLTSPNATTLSMFKNPLKTNSSLELRPLKVTFSPFEVGATLYNYCSNEFSILGYIGRWQFCGDWNGKSAAVSMNSERQITKSFNFPKADFLVLWEGFRLIASSEGINNLLEALP